MKVDGVGLGSSWDGNGWRVMGTLGMEGWVEGDRVAWYGRMGRGRWGLLGREDG